MKDSIGSVEVVIGMPEMNLVDATLAREDGGKIRLGNQAIAVEPDLGKRLTHKGGPVTFGIRPQHIELVPAGTPGALNGTVRIIEFMGHEVNLHAEIEGNFFISVVPSEKFDRSMKTGDRVALKPAARHIHIFDRGTGLNASLGQ